MPKVYTIDPGLEVRLGTAGVARYDEPAIVSEDVARDVEKDKRLRVERDAPPRLAVKQSMKKREE